MTIVAPPDRNPKTAFGIRKPPLHFVPLGALLMLGGVMALGAFKYGPFNWRDDRISASVYFDAAIRHLFLWFSGENVDEESGQPHLAHVMACCAILLDGEEHKSLNDDRPTSPSVRAILDRVAASK